MPIGPFRTYNQPVNVGSLEERFEAGADVTLEALKAAGLIAKLSRRREGARRGRAHEEALRHRALVLQVGGREDRGRGRHGDAAARAGRAEEEEAQGSQRRSPRSRDEVEETTESGAEAEPSPRRAEPTEDRSSAMFSLARERLAGSGAPQPRALHGDACSPLYRLGSWIPAPGVDSQTIQDYFSGRGGTILGLLNLFSGGALSQFSLFALGIMPYVTASIIIQLMTVVIPQLGELQREGEAGYAKITQYTRYLTVILAAAQATGYAFLFRSQGALNAGSGRDGPHHRLPDRRNRAAHVDRRAHHEARHRQRHLDPHLRVDPRRRAARHRRLVERRADGEALLPAHRGRDLRCRRVRPGGPAPHPGPVREADGGPQDDRRRLDLPPAAREHGGRHPDHLRGGDPRVPADDGAVLPGDARLRQQVLPARRLDLPPDRGRS